MGFTSFTSTLISHKTLKRTAHQNILTLKKKKRGKIKPLHIFPVLQNEEKKHKPS